MMKDLFFSILAAAVLGTPSSTKAQNLVNYALPDVGGAEVTVYGDLATNNWFNTSKINDNDLETKWLSCDSKEYENQWTKHWVVIDLGTERDINEIDIHWAETANIYYVCLTNDEDVMSKVKAEAGKEEPVPANIGEVVASKNYHDQGVTAQKGEVHKFPLDAAKKARYVVLLTTKDWIADTGYGVGVYELMVLGKPSAPTGITSKTVTEKTADVYDLSGRRVKSAHKGIYIVNGKKMVRK